MNLSIFQCPHTMLAYVSVEVFVKDFTDFFALFSEEGEGACKIRILLPTGNQHRVNLG